MMASVNQDHLAILVQHGGMDPAMLEPSRLAHLMEANMMLEEMAPWRVMPVDACGECFFKAVASELNLDLAIANCRLVYVLVLSCRRRRNSCLL